MCSSSLNVCYARLCACVYMCVCKCACARRDDMDEADPFVWTDVCNMPMADEHVERASVQPSHDAPQLPPVGIAAELRRSPHVLVADQSYVSQVCVYVSQVPCLLRSICVCS